MPKAILEFQLPEEQYEYEQHVKALDRAGELESRMREIHNRVRTELKYGHGTADSLRETLEQVRKLSYQED